MDQEVKELLTKIAEMSPHMLDRYDEDICFYCDANFTYNEEHAADCVYVKICQLVNIEPQR